MTGWTTHEGIAVALPLENIDTDQLIPARFMSVPRAQGYGPYLLHDMRRTGDGEPDPAFPINRHPEASILVTRRNFGTGSSREAAVYALLDAGIQVVVSSSFGDIFASNAVNNGLLPARVRADELEELLERLGTETLPAVTSLSDCRIMLGDINAPFSLDPVWQQKIINGWDDIDLTASHRAAIAAHAATLRRDRPWLWPEAENI